MQCDSGFAGLTLLTCYIWLSSIEPDLECVCCNSVSYINFVFFDQNEAKLIIGHHILEGKKQKLEKPFAVLTKDDNRDRGSVTSYSAVAIIRQKLTFSVLPKPIIANVPKTMNSNAIWHWLCDFLTFRFVCLYQICRCWVLSLLYTCFCWWNSETARK